MMLSMEMPEKLEKSSDEKIVVSARNLDGNDIKASGTYRVFTLLENDSTHRQAVAGQF